jgi:hydroxyacyl-ACP dehydratase HTD2-like protein with hotdog domain
MSDGRTAQIRWQDVKVGDELPGLAATPSEIQLFFFSAATNNGHRIHYDLPYAQSEGLPGLLVQGPLQAALLARMLTDWVGPRGRVVRFQIQNRGNAFPGQTLHFGGVVTAKREQDGRRLVDCEIAGRNADGQVLMPGHATVSLPRD